MAWVDGEISSSDINMHLFMVLVFDSNPVSFSKVLFMIKVGSPTLLGGVYMRKLTPARVSYQDDFLISYRIYMMTGPFHISLFEGTLYVDKIHV